MARRNESILDILVELPWWVSVVFSGLTYLGLMYIVPSIKFAQNGPTDIASPLITGMLSALPPLAPVIALVLLIPAPISAIKSFGKRKRLDRQSGIESIRVLLWKQFEELLGEAYRRQGFVVQENSSLGPDGGVDLTIEKGGNRYLVQCKQWRVQKVGVKVVREMFGVMTAQRANGVIIVTSGMFTQEALTFAADKPIDLVAGNQLVELVRTVQVHAAGKKTNIGIAPEQINPRAVAGKSVTVVAQKTTAIIKQCPNCGGNLVLREAKRGSNVGSKFWGCSSYPKCRHTEEYQG